MKEQLSFLESVLKLCCVLRTFLTLRKQGSSIDPSSTDGWSSLGLGIFARLYKDQAAVKLGRITLKMEQPFKFAIMHESLIIHLPRKEENVSV